MDELSVMDEEKEVNYEKGGMRRKEVDEERKDEEKG